MRRFIQFGLWLLEVTGWFVGRIGERILAIRVRPDTIVVIACVLIVIALPFVL